MPTLKKVETRKVLLPSFAEDSDPAWVMLETPAKISDFEQVDTTLPEVAQSSQILTSKIKDWNLTDEKGEKLPITRENVAELDAVDFATLSIELGLNKLSRLTTQKKTS